MSRDKLPITVLWVGIGSIVIVCLYPPWAMTYQAQGISQFRQPLGWSLITNPPAVPAKFRDKLYVGRNVDFERLTIELIVVVTLAVGAFYTSKLRFKNGDGT